MSAIMAQRIKNHRFTISIAATDKYLVKNPAATLDSIEAKYKELGDTWRAAEDRPADCSKVDWMWSFKENKNARLYFWIKKVYNGMLIKEKGQRFAFWR